MKQLSFFTKHVTCLLFLILLYFSSYAQGHLQQRNRGPISPGGLLDTVFDGYGNKYSLRDITIDDTLRAAGRTPQGLIVENYCSSGYFKLYLEDSCGMDHYATDTTEAKRLAIVCQVLQDISAFINSPCSSTGQKVKIWVRKLSDLQNVPANAVGLATSFYNIPTGSTASGIADNEVWLTLHTGVDAYKNVASPVMSNSNNVSSGSTYFHGMMAFNFTPNGIVINGQTITWNTDLANPPSSNQLDLYSVVFHEMMHALGFASAININGSSVLGSNSSYYTRYDKNLVTSGGTPLITNGGACDMYDYSFTAPLSNLAPDPTNCIPDYTDCSTAIKYSGGTTQQVYTPNCWELGSSLSHFEDMCPTAANNNIYYVMSNGIIPGTYLRALKQEERQVLCDIGYNVNATFGNVLNLNNASYTGGVCTGISVAGINDGLDTNGFFTYVSAGGAPVSISGILNNDYGADSFVCLEVVNGLGSGTLSTTTGSASTTITYTPSSSSSAIHLLRYIPVNSSGQRGNITYVYVYVADSSCPSLSSCDLVKNGTFESSQNCGDFGGIVPGENAHVDCWSQAIAWSINLFSRGCIDPNGSFYNSSIPTTTFSPTLESFTGPGNDHFIGLNGYGAVQTILGGGGLQNGTTYQISCWAKVSGPFSPYFQFLYPDHNSDSLGNIPAYLSFFAGGGVYAGSQNLYPVPPGLTPLITFTVQPDSPTNGDWHYFSGQFTYSGSAVGKTLIMGNNIALMFAINPTQLNTSLVLVDNVSIKPASNSVSFTLPDTMSTCDTDITDLSQYVTTPYSGVFFGSNVTDNSGVYGFSPVAAVLQSGPGIKTIGYAYTDNNGCNDTVYAQPFVENGNLSLSLSASANPSCPGQSITLTASGCNTCTWPSGQGLSTGSGTTNTATPTSSTTYQVVDTDAYHCVSEAQLLVLADTIYPVVLLGADTIGSTTLCSGTSFLLGAFPIGSYSYQWQQYNNSTHHYDDISWATGTAIPLNSGGKYRVGISIGGTCTFYSDTAFITVLDSTGAVISPGGTVNLCPGDSVLLTAGTTSGISYQWQSYVSGQWVAITTATASTYEASIPGVYRVIVSGTYGCVSTSASVNVISTIAQAAISPNSTTICSGSSVTLNATTGSGYTYHWYLNGSHTPISGATSATYSPTPANPGNNFYRVAITDMNGCSDTSAAVDVIVDTPAIAHISGPDTVIICLGGNTTLSATNQAGYMYQWKLNGNTIVGATSATYSPLTGGNYTVQVSSGGCSPVVSNTVTIIILGTTACSPCAIFGGNYFTTYGSGNYIPANFSGSSGNYYVNNDILITGSGTISNTNIVFAKNVTVYIDSSATIIFDNCHLSGCDSQWNGIVVLTKANNTASGHLTLQDNTLVEDAKKAVRLRGLYTNSSNALTTSGAIFNKNTVGIEIDTFHTYYDFPASVTNTIFTSRSLASSYNSWPSVSTLKSSLATLTAYKPPYKLDSFATTLCLNGGPALDGIIFNGVGSTFDTGSYSGITIGADNSGLSAGDMNLFDNLNYGVLANASNMTFYNNTFMNMKQVNGKGGDGISADGNGDIAYQLYVLPNSDTTNGNSFYNCKWSGVEAHNYYDVAVLNSMMMSSQTLADTTTICYYGVNVQAPIKYFHLRADNNQVANIKYGISMLIGSSSIGTTQSHQKLRVVGNTVQVVPVSGPSAAYNSNHFVSIGINTQNTLNSLIGGPVTVTLNNILDAYNGIILNSMTTLNLAAGYNHLSADGNTITLRQTPSLTAQYGISTTNCTEGSLFGNTVGGTGSTNDSMRAMYTSGSIATSQSCNVVSDLGRGFEFVGSQPYTAWFPANTMENNGKGLVIDAGFISSQGYVNSPTDTGTPMFNGWLGTWSSTKVQTYSEHRSKVGQLVPVHPYGIDQTYGSWLWVDTTDSQEYPTFNATDYPFPGYYYGGSGSGGGSGLMMLDGPGTGIPSCSPVPVPPLVPVGPSRGTSISTIFTPVVTDLINSSQLDNTQKWLTQFGAFQYLTVDTFISYISDTNGTLRDFVETAKTGRYGQLSHIDAYLTDGDISDALTEIAAKASIKGSKADYLGVTVADNDSDDYIVENYIKYYKTYISYLESTMNSDDTANLISLANLCPLTNGNVVYQARALYALVLSPQIWTDDNCSDTTIEGRMTSNSNNNTVPPSVTDAIRSYQHYSLYPDPSDGNITIRQAVPDMQPVNAEVWNNEGKSIYKNRILFTNGHRALNLKGLVPGLYLLHLRDNYGNDYTLKFIVN